MSLLWLTGQPVLHFTPRQLFTAAMWRTRLSTVGDNDSTLLSSLTVLMAMTQEIDWRGKTIFSPLYKCISYNCIEAGFFSPKYLTLSLFQMNMLKQIRFSKNMDIILTFPVVNQPLPRQGWLMKAIVAYSCSSMCRVRVELEGVQRVKWIRGQLLGGTHCPLPSCPKKDKCPPKPWPVWEQPTSVW